MQQVGQRSGRGEWWQDEPPLRQSTPHPASQLTIPPVAQSEFLRRTPASAQHAARHRHGARSVRLRRRVAVAAVALTISGLALAAVLSARAPAIVGPVASWFPDVSEIAPAVGLGLDQIAVSGHRFTADTDIFTALALDKARLLVAFDGKSARERIEALPWVATAELTRIYPGQLDVRITERTPFAVWQRAADEVLVDRSGRVLQKVSPGSVSHLPRIAGEDAAANAADLLLVVARYPLLAERFARAERVAGRRWSIHLANGSRIELPADGEALALSAADTRGQLAALAADRPVVVDLRAPGRTAVRHVPKLAARSPVETVAGIGGLIESLATEETPP